VRFAGARNAAILGQGALDGDRTVSDSPSEPAIDLGYIGQALQLLTSEVASLRDDTHVLTAIVQRLDNSQGRMLQELRADFSVNQICRPGEGRDPCFN
jgi:hypothetical protein